VQDSDYEIFTVRAHNVRHRHGIVGVLRAPVRVRATLQATCPALSLGDTMIDKLQMSADVVPDPEPSNFTFTRLHLASPMSSSVKPKTHEFGLPTGD
jgi:hypothetical protein